MASALAARDERRDAVEDAVQADDELFVLVEAVLADSATMIGRSLRLSRRNLDAQLMALLPVVLMALFVYVFGGAIHAGTDYLDYVVPGIILLCVGFGAATTAVSVCTDMTSG